MAESNIHDVNRVAEIDGDQVPSNRDVNAYLREGWILLHICTRTVGSDNGPSERPLYVLGWTRAEDPPW